MARDYPPDYDERLDDVEPWEEPADGWFEDVTEPWQRLPDYSLGGLDVWVGDDTEAPDVTAFWQSM